MVALTEKQKLFVQEYLKDLNATQAAIRAGYSARTANKTGSEVLGKTNVRQAIMEAQKARAEKLDIDTSWVLTRLKLISDRCIQGEPVFSKDGEPSGEWKFDAAGANRATELIAKHLGMFTEKHEHSGQGGVPLEVIFNIPRPQRYIRGNHDNDDDTED